MKKCRLLLITIVFPLIIGCSADNDSYDYLIMHPYALKAAYERCILLPPIAVQSDPFCSTVMRAAITLESLTKTAAYSQLKFGLQLMQIESNIVAAQEELIKAKAQHDEAQVDNIQENIDQLQAKRRLYLMVIHLIRNM